MRTRDALLLLSGLGALACGGNEDRDYSTSPPVHYTQPTHFDGGLTPHVIGGDKDATEEDAATAEPDVGTPADALLTDAGRDTGVVADATTTPDGALNQCVATGDCGLVVDLQACNPCPVALPLRSVGQGSCLETYRPGFSIFEYNRPDCVAGCGANDLSCQDPAGGVECRDHLCRTFQ